MTEENKIREEFPLQQLSTHEACCSCSYLVYVYDTSTYHCYHQCKERNSRRLRTMGYERVSESDSRPTASTRSLCAWMLLAQICIILSTTLCGVWFANYKGGYSWDEHMFNYHPSFMTFGFIFVYGQGMLSFKMMQFCSSRVVQYLHAFLNIIGIVFVMIAMYAVFHGNKHNLYSLHSWIGIAVVVLYCLQWLCGFLVFLFPSVSVRTRALYKHVHVFWGVVLFCGAAVAIITGIMDENISDYSSHSSEGMVANFFGAFTMMAAIVVSYVVYNPEFVRQPQLEDESIPIN